MSSRPLTEKQRLFVRALPAVGFNATEAARRAGYAESSLRQQASENLAKPHIMDAIAETVAPMLRELQTDAERVLAELAALAFSDVTAYMTWDDEANVYITPSHQLTPAQRGAIKKVRFREKTTERESPDGSTARSTTRRLDFDLHSKEQALRVLGKITQLIKEKNPIVQNILMMIQNMPPEMMRELVEGGTPAMRELLEGQGYRVAPGDEEDGGDA